MLEASKSFKFSLVTPSGTRVDYILRHLRAPGTEGDFGVLAGHVPFMATLRIGVLLLDMADGSTENWAIAGGFAEVAGDNVIILAEAAEPSGKIDIERARIARERALGRLQSSESDMDQVVARAALTRSLNRIAVAEGRHGR